MGRRVPRHLHNCFYRYRRAEEEESDDESEDSSDDVSSEDGLQHLPVDRDPQQCSDLQHHISAQKNKHTNDDGEEWAKSQQKKDIIAAFQDQDSGIHGLSPTQIFEEYAAGHGWIKKNAEANIRRLRKQFHDKKGPFIEIEVDEVEPFKTRKTKSKAYSLLLKLHIESERSGIEKMSIKELHGSHECFLQYPLQDFKKYNNDMIKLVKRRKAKLQQDTVA